MVLLQVRGGLLRKCFACHHVDPCTLDSYPVGLSNIYATDVNADQHKRNRRMQWFESKSHSYWCWCRGFFGNMSSRYDCCDNLSILYTQKAAAETQRWVGVTSGGRSRADATRPSQQFTASIRNREQFTTRARKYFTADKIRVGIATALTRIFSAYARVYSEGFWNYHLPGTATKCCIIAILPRTHAEDY